MIHLPAASITSGQPASSRVPGVTVAATPSRIPRVRVCGALPVPSNHNPSRMITSYVTVASRSIDCSEPIIDSEHSQSFLGCDAPLHQVLVKRVSDRAWTAPLVEAGRWALWVRRGSAGRWASGTVTGAGRGPPAGGAV